MLSNTLKKLIPRLLNMGPFLKKDLARGNTTISHHGIQKQLKNKIQNRSFVTQNTHTPDKKVKVKNNSFSITAAV